MLEPWQKLQREDDDTFATFNTKGTNMNTIINPHAPVNQDEHKHHCEQCNTYWKHSNFNAGNEEAHQCPRCGTEQWEKFYTRNEETQIELAQSFYAALAGQRLQPREHRLLGELANQFYNELGM